MLRKLEELQERQIEKTLQPTEKPAMPAEEQAEALALLKDPNLLDRLLTDFTRCGVVGEESQQAHRLFSRDFPQARAPLAVMVQSSSAAGKSSLMEAVLAFMPAEDKVQYSAMTGQSLFYMGAMDLKHKILATRRRSRRRACKLCAEAPAKRRDTLHRLHRQGPRDRQARDPRIPGRRPGDDLLDEHRDRSRRGAAQSLL